MNPCSCIPAKFIAFNVSSNSKIEYEKPFPYEDLLKEKLRRQLEINTQLEIKDEKENIIDMPERSETVIAVPQMAAAAR